MRSLITLALAAAPIMAYADAAAMLGIINPATADVRPTFRLEATAFLADDFIAVQEIGDTWTDTPDPRKGRNRAVGFGRLEASQSYGAWSIGVFRRFDAVGKTNDSTVRIYHALSDPGALSTADSRSRLDYGFQGFSADGLRLSWNMHPGRENIRIGASINLLKPGAVRIEKISGTATTANGVTTVRGQRTLLASNLDYTPPAKAKLNDFSPANEANTNSAWGQSLDVGASWAHNELIVRLAVNDLFGQLHWRNLPEQLQNFNDVKWPVNFNEPSATAKITGSNRYRDYTLDLKPKAALSVQWSRGSWGLSGSLAATRDLILPEVAAAWAPSASSQFELSYEPRFKSLGLGLRAGPLYVQLRSDRLDTDSARTLGFSTGIAVRF